MGVVQHYSDAECTSLNYTWLADAQFDKGCELRGIGIENKGVISSINREHRSWIILSSSKGVEIQLRESLRRGASLGEH